MFVADRLGLDASAIDRYTAGTEERARQRHLELVLDRLGWTPAGPGEWKLLNDWLIERALEHDAPSVLFRQALVHLRTQQILRPGLDGV